MKECSFCSEFIYDVSDYSLFEKIRTENFNSRVIWQNEHFILAPTIGCFLEGYVLLITKRHIPTFGALNHEESQSLKQIFPKIIQVIKKEYGGGVIFEHGSVGLCKTGGGACEDHAHLHFIPKNVEFKPEMENLFKFKRLPNFEELKKYETNGIPYLMISTPNKDLYICEAYYVQSQLLRIITTMKEGIAEYWNWKKHPFAEKMYNTYRKLKQNDILNNLR